MRQCSSSVSGSACARQRTGIRERLLSGSKGPITMFSRYDGGLLSKIVRAESIMGALCNHSPPISGKPAKLSFRR